MALENFELANAAQVGRTDVIAHCYRATYSCGMKKRKRSTSQINQSMTKF
jgi:hypothetical protein